MKHFNKNNFTWILILVLILYTTQFFSMMIYPNKFGTIKSLFDTDVLVLFQTPYTKFGGDMIVSQKKLIVPTLNESKVNYKLENFNDSNKIRAVVCYIPNNENNTCYIILTRKTICSSWIRL